MFIVTDGFLGNKAVTQGFGSDATAIATIITEGFGADATASDFVVTEGFGAGPVVSVVAGFTSFFAFWIGGLSGAAAPVVSVTPTPTTGAGGGRWRSFGWYPEPRKRKPRVEVGYQTIAGKVEIKYISVPPQPAFPMEVLWDLEQLLKRNEHKRKAAIQEALDEADELEDILVIMRLLN